MRMLIVIAAFGMVGAQMAQSHPPAVWTTSQWRDVLLLAEKKSEAARRRLSAIAARSDETPEVVLARQVIDNKDAQSNQDRVAVPQLLQPLRFKPVALATTEAGVVVVEVHVDKNGCVTRAAVLRKHSSESITGEARRFIENAPFVPAFKAGRFVSGHTTVVAPISVY